MSNATDKNVYTAYREAGRCVMGWYAGYTVFGSTIEAAVVDAYRGRTVYQDDWSTPGDLGVNFIEHPKHGLVVENPDGTGRLPTDVEREHTRLTDLIVELHDWQQQLMVAAAGEAAGRIADPQQVHPDHSRSERNEAYEIAPNESWDAWVLRAQKFLQQPAVWHHVSTVARGLLRQATLYQEDITGLIRDGFGLEYVGDESRP